MASIGTVMPAPKYTAYDNNGAPLSGGLLYVYEAGTSTPATTYSDVDLSIPNTNPVVLDAGGRATVFLAPGSYKFVQRTSADVVVWTQDNISSVAPFNVDVDTTGTAGENLSAGDAVYLATGAGGTTAGRWYKADADAVATSSEALTVGMVPDAILLGAAGSIRLLGQITLVGPLSSGAAYYLSGTAGAITVTAPTNARFIGQAASTTSLLIGPTPGYQIVNTTLVALAAQIKSVCTGRLTLTTGVPVTTTDVTAATTLYFTPYAGNRIGLYTGSAWAVVTFSELSIAVPATTNQMYDVFVDYNDGTTQLAVTAWTNDTTRATLLTLQDGVLVKTGDTQQRYVGSFRTTAVSGQAEDSGEKRFVWNYGNRVPRSLKRTYSTDSWTYTLAAFQQANASTANQVGVVIGVAEAPVDLAVQHFATNGGTINVWAGIGYDSTTVPIAVSQGVVTIAAVQRQLITRITHYPAIGFHYYAWLERSTASGTTTWYGDNGDATLLQSGLFGWIAG